MKKRAVLPAILGGALLLSLACNNEGGGPTPTATTSVAAPTATTAAVATSTPAVSPTLDITATAVVVGTPTAALDRTPTATSATPSPAATSTGGSAAARLAVKPWAVGQRAAYESTSSEGTAFFTYSLVDREGADWWLEVKIASSGQPPSVMKMLVSDFSQGGPMTVKRMIVQQQGQPAMEMPAFLVGQMQDSMVTGDSSRVNENIVGTETRTVKAGTFANAVHARYVDGDTATDGYFHPTAPITGMVYVVSTTQGQPPMTMELTAYQESGATSEITGPVQPFPGAP